jgi:peptidoglycan/LPS O-acetylase OafA/YrhL
MAAHAPVERIHALDGLRGVLALFVVVYHLLSPLPVLQPLVDRWLPLLHQGWYAVDVFFVMSGFVMLHVYGRQFSAAMTLRQFGRFMWARFARLYPVHLCAMLATLMLMLPALSARWPELFSFSGRYSLGAFGASLLLAQSPWLPYRSWNYPAWSISAEWHAYLVFPLLMLALRRLDWRRALWLVAAGVLLPLLAYLYGGGEEQYPTNGVPVLLRVLPLFAAGMALYLVWQRVRRLPSTLAALAVLGTPACLWWAPAAPYAVLLVPLAALFGTAPMLWLGKISYSLYMTHALVEAFGLGVATRALARRGWQPGPEAAVVLLLLALGGALALGWMTWKWVEVPGRNFLIRHLSPTPQKT